MQNIYLHLTKFVSSTLGIKLKNANHLGTWKRIPQLEFIIRTKTNYLVRIDNNLFFTPEETPSSTAHAVSIGC